MLAHATATARSAAAQNEPVPSATCPPGRSGTLASPMHEPEHRAAYYRAAMSLLRFVEQRAPTQRRFGSEADALWRSFAGSLERGDRIDLLLRDADRQWGSAFGARTVFSLQGVHELDAFGADWESLGRGEADALWRDAKAPGSQAQALAALLAAWGVREPKPFALPKLGPSSRLVVAGLGALLACARAFLDDADLSWPNQVAVVADAPGVRQLAAAVPALGDFGEATVLLGSGQIEAERKRVRARLGSGIELLASPDASIAERMAASQLVGG